MGGILLRKGCVNNSQIAKQDLKGIIDSFRSGFPDFRISVEDQIGEGNKVVTRVTLRGTHQGEISGIAATGEEVQYAGIAIDRIADGKVVEMWHVSDDWGMLRQLGVAANVK
jgi:predicted ester cyclase